MKAPLLNQKNRDMTFTKPVQETLSETEPWTHDLY